MQVLICKCDKPKYHLVYKRYLVHKPSFFSYTSSALIFQPHWGKWEVIIQELNCSSRSPHKAATKKNELCCVFKANKVEIISLPTDLFRISPVCLTRLCEFLCVEGDSFIQTVITVREGESSTYQVPNLRPASLLPSHSFLHGHTCRLHRQTELSSAEGPRRTHRVAEQIFLIFFYRYSLNV